MNWKLVTVEGLVLVAIVLLICVPTTVLSLGCCGTWVVIGVLFLFLLGFPLFESCSTYRKFKEERENKKLDCELKLHYEKQIMEVRNMAKDK